MSPSAGAPLRPGRLFSYGPASTGHRARLAYPMSAEPTTRELLDAIEALRDEVRRLREQVEELGDQRQLSPSGLVDVQGLADYLNVSKRTVRRMVPRKEVATKRVGRSLRFDLGSSSGIPPPSPHLEIGRLPGGTFQRMSDSQRDTVEKIREAANGAQLDRIPNLILAAVAAADSRQRADIQRTLVAKLPGLLLNNYLIPVRRIDVHAFERVNPDWMTQVQRAGITSRLAEIIDEMVRRSGAMNPT